MNILMMTNTYAPLVGGLERSVKSFTEAYRKRGHRVVVVAPKFKNMPKREAGIIRVPSIAHVGGSPFSVNIPIPGLLAIALKKFRPDIVHSHHPFLLGDTAYRTALLEQAPLVFTHHTLFEQYTHYLPLRAEIAKPFLIRLATDYANLADQVFAPSQSVADLLRLHGVTTPIAIVPTGVERSQFGRGKRGHFIKASGLPEDAFIVGHLGRLSKEKNLRFLAQAVATFLKQEPRAWFVVAGAGADQEMIRQLCQKTGAAARLYYAGELTGQALADAYAAMDVFAFASKSETQGLVLIEAMSAGVPVVAVDAPGVREVVVDQRNGRLLPKQDVADFVAALRWVMRLPPARRRALAQGAEETAKAFSMERCASRALDYYAALVERYHHARPRNEHRWAKALRRIQAEVAILRKTTDVTKVLLKEASSHRQLHAAAI